MLSILLSRSVYGFEPLRYLKAIYPSDRCIGRWYSTFMFKLNTDTEVPSEGGLKHNLNQAKAGSNIYLKRVNTIYKFCENVFVLC